jgi:hypothetical protein
VERASTRCLLYCQATGCRQTCNTWSKLKNHVREDHIEKLLDPGEPPRIVQAMENNDVGIDYEYTHLELQLSRFEKDTGKRACEYKAMVFEQTRGISTQRTIQR